MHSWCDLSNLGKNELLTFTPHCHTRDICIRGARGALTPWILTTQKGPKFGMSRAVAKARQSIFEYFLNLFWMFCEISGPLSHAAYTERSTIADLSIKIPGPLNPAAYWRSTFFSKGQKCVKKGPTSQMPPPLGNLIKISLHTVRIFKIIICTVTL